MRNENWLSFSDIDIRSDILLVVDFTIIIVVPESIIYSIVPGHGRVNQSQAPADDSSVAYGVAE